MFDRLMFDRLVGKNKLSEVPLTLDQVYDVLGHFGERKVNVHVEMFPAIDFREPGIPANEAIGYLRMNLEPPQGKSIDDCYIGATHERYSEKTGIKHIIQASLGNRHFAEGSDKEIRDNPLVTVTIDYIVQTQG